MNWVLIIADGYARPAIALPEGATVLRVYGRGSLRDQLQLYAERRPVRHLTEVQVCLPGDERGVYAGGIEVSARRDLAIIAPLLDARAVVWFRGGAVFQGPAGQVFAARACKALDCYVAGHTRLPGLLWHSGLWVLAPRRSPAWEPGEGVSGGRSGLFRRRTVSVFRRSFPRSYIP